MTELFTMLFTLGSKLMDKLPNYPQHKKEMYYELLRSYHRLMEIPEERRDDNLVAIKRSELIDMLRVFIDEITTVHT